MTGDAARGAWVALAACVLAGCAPAQPGLERLSIATGGTAGVYYVYGGAMARVLSRHLEGVEVTAEVTAASAENLELLDQGAADLAFSLADTALQAARGEGRFGRPLDVRLVAVLYDNVTHLATSAGAGPARLADLRGRRVSLGAPGSGTELIAERTLRAAGLDPAVDLARERLGAGESSAALRDGRIDAFFWSGGLPTAAVLELAHAPGFELRLLDTAEVLGALRAAHGDVYHAATIPEGTYARHPEVAVTSVPSLLVARASLPADLVHDVLATLFAHRDDLAAAHPVARELSRERAGRPGPLEQHPGAARFYAESIAASPAPP